MFPTDDGAFCAARKTGRPWLRRLSVVSLAALCLSVAACGSSSSTGGSSSSGAPASSGQTSSASSGAKSLAGKKVAIVSLPNSNPWAAVYNTTIKSYLTAHGAKVNILGSTDPATQVQLLDSAVAQHPDLIFLEALDSKAVAPAIAKAKAAGVTILNTDGLVMKFFRTTHLLSVTSALGWTNGQQLLSSPLAVVTGLTYNFLPFMTLPLFASLDRLDPRLLEAAGDLYARPITTFRRITLPMSMPGVVAGTLLTFIPAAGDFINSQLLGNPQTAMIGQVIDGQFLRVLDYPTAAALSFVLMLSIVLLVSIYVRRAGT